MTKKLFVIMGVVIVVIIGLFLKPYLIVRELSSTSDPKMFAEKFDPTSKETVEFKVGGLVGRTIKSPLFPYRELKTQTIKATYPHIIYSNGSETDLTEEGRWINTDPFWNVFWVEISPPKAYERSKFYGPYRIE